MKLVLVTWEDSRIGPDSWVLLRELDQQDTVTVKTVGWVVKQDEHKVVLAHSLGRYPDQICGIIVIPKRSVRNVQELGCD